MIAVSREGAIAAAEQQQEQGEEGVVWQEEGGNDNLPYPKDDDKNYFEGEVCVSMGIIPKHFDV